MDLLCVSHWTYGTDLSSNILALQTINTPHAIISNRGLNIFNSNLDYYVLRQAKIVYPSQPSFILIKGFPIPSKFDHPT